MSLHMKAAVWLAGRRRLSFSMLSATAQGWCVCRTTFAPVMRWIGAWMQYAESSTLPVPSSVAPFSSKTTMSLARASDQCSPKGRIRYCPSRPGTVTVKWLSMPSSSSCSVASRSAAASWTLASVMASVLRSAVSGGIGVTRDEFLGGPGLGIEHVALHLPDVGAVCVDADRDAIVERVGDAVDVADGGRHHLDLAALEQEVVAILRDAAAH